MDYFTGMTRAEAINYVEHLPDLTNEEYADLMVEAERRPETRWRPQTTNKVMQTRVEKLMEYAMEHKKIYRGDLASHWHGKILGDVLRAAVAMKLLVRQREGKKHVWVPIEA